MGWVEETRARGSPVFLTYQCCCASYLLLLVLTYGTLIVFNPLFYIDDFYVPALNKALNSTPADTVIFFNLIIQNQERDVGIRYDAVNLTFSYASNASTSMVLGTYTVPGFYQGMKKTARRRDVVMVTSSLLALGDISKDAEFRVDLVTHVKFKNWFWYFRHKRITAGGTVKVDDSGKKQSGDSLELKSGKPPSGLVVGLWFVGFIILILVGVSFIVLGVLGFYQIIGYRPT